MIEDLDLETRIFLEEALSRGILGDAPREKRFAEDSLFQFATEVLGFRDLNLRTHGPTIEVLESSWERKLVVLPRGCLKSSLCSVAYPIWRLIKNPNLRILLDSEVYTNSAKFLFEIKGLIQSQEFVRHYGNWKPGKLGFRWTEGEIDISERTIIKKEANITCSGVGAQKTGQHYDLIISDDLSSPKNTTTKEIREKVKTHFRLYSSLLDPGGELAVVGTRYHTEDTIGHILSLIQAPEEELF